MILSPRAALDVRHWEARRQQSKSAQHQCGLFSLRWNSINCSVLYGCKPVLLWLPFWHSFLHLIQLLPS